MLLAPFLPFSAQRLHEMLGYDDVLAGPPQFETVVEVDGGEHVVLTGDYASWTGSWEPSRLPAGQRLRDPSPLFTKLDPDQVVADELARMQAADDVTDSHAHLDARGVDAPSAVAQANSAGVTRIVTIGTGIDSCRAALEIADAHEGVYAALGDRPASGRNGRGDEDG